MDRPLKILYISHYYPPEVNAPALRVSEMSGHWAAQGHDITVLTGFPNHPNGIIPDDYKGLIRAKEKQGQVKIIRTFVYAAPNRGFFKRILNYLSFMFSSIVLGTGRVGKPDVLIATSPQFFVAVAGYIISRIKRCKFIFEVRDLWPEEIVAVGAIKNRFIISLLEVVELFLYRQADLIVAVAQGTIDTLVKRGIPAEKLALIPNGADIEQFRHEDSQVNVKRTLGFDKKFVVSYIGTLGLAHRLETVLEAAHRLKDNTHIRFLFVGDGAEKEKLVRYARELKLGNVYFYGQMDHRRIPAYYQGSDLLLVPLRKADLFTRNIPSKIYEIMAAGKPMIIAADGESRKLVEGAGAGLGVAPENSAVLAGKIQYLFENQELCSTMGANGRVYVTAHASRKRMAEDYVKVMKNLVERNTLGTKMVIKRGAEVSSEPETKSRIRELMKH